MHHDEFFIISFQSYQYASPFPFRVRTYFVTLLFVFQSLYKLQCSSSVHTPSLRVTSRFLESCRGESQRTYGHKKITFPFDNEQASVTVPHWVGLASILISHRTDGESKPKHVQVDKIIQSFHHYISVTHSKGSSRSHHRNYLIFPQFLWRNKILPLVNIFHCLVSGCFDLCSNTKEQDRWNNFWTKLFKYGKCSCRKSDIGPQKSEE